MNTLRYNKGSLIVVSFVMIALTIILRNLLSSYDNDLIFAIKANCIVAVFVYFWLIICCSRISSRSINIYSLFLLFSFLFYFGQHFVILMGRAEVLSEEYYRSILDYRIPNSSRIGAGYFVLVVMLIVNIGVLVKHKVPRNTVTNSVYDLAGLNYCSEKVAKTIFIIVLIPTFIKYAFDAVHTQTLGYTESLEASAEAGGIMKLCYFLSYYFLPSLYILLISYAKKKRKILLFAIYGVFACVYLCTGSRFRIFESLIAILLIYDLRIKEFRKRDLIKLFFGGVLILITFSIVRESREAIIVSGGDLISAIGVIWDGLLEEGLFTSALIEMGSTFQVVDVVYNYCPTIVPFSNGESLIGAIMIALPSFLRFGFDLDSVNVSRIFSPLYVTDIDIGMGSSFISEGFYNFGYVSLLYFFIIGCFIGKLLSSSAKYEKSGDNFHLFRYVYVSSLICFCIRTDLVSFLRYYLYYVLFIEIVIKLLYLSSSRKRMHYSIKGT